MANALVVPRDQRSLRAAQYVRMSTERQQYSVENQAAAIAAYAQLHNLEIVRTYSDEGESGLQLKHRTGLIELLNDVQSGDANFGRILVYDVSRWGRFQDTDESAYYEFICKLARIEVNYCAEPFDNDGSMISSILKNIKRVMAAEYSRELSARVFAGQCRLVTQGFWQGSHPGYGLRRQLVDANRRPKAFLANGEWKSIVTDRIILQPGPLHEVETVRRIFKSYAIDGKNEIAIAKELNDEGIHNPRGQPWKRNTISYILSSEKYAGHNVYNRVSHKLKRKHVKNSPELWVRADNAFTPIVDPELFVLTQRKLEEWSAKRSSERMLADLSLLLKEKGRLTCKLIDQTPWLCRSQSYWTRFGSILAAYDLIGYRPKSKFRYVASRREHRAKVNGFLTGLFAEFEKVSLTARFDWNSRAYIVNEKVTIAIYLLRCLRTNCGSMQWNLRQDRKLATSLVLAARMNETNDGIHDYLLLPGDHPFYILRFSKTNAAKLAGC